MKIKLAVVIGAFALSGCASYQHNRNAVSTFLYGPDHASKEEITKMSEVAWWRYNEGNSIDAACAKARRELKIRSKNPSYELSRCHMNLKAMDENMRNEQAAYDAQVRRQAQVQRRADQFNQRIAKIRSGQAEIQTPREAEVIYEAPSGQHLSSKPLVQPDKKSYTISGRIDASGGLQQDRFMMRIMDFGEPRYAYVHLQRKAGSLPPSAHVDSHVIVVGSYVENMPYTTIIGEQRVMPVFNAMFVKVLR